ncbi:nucleotide pyrophosphohydrolase [Pseudogracilibacillus auburnensis]|uniref:NTP pyrophosphatase (Non-canonical NTP hydrolase) n=1 Tax=Pseudogracilibacillus auburnensis TaxID=1494959 RepID=A0A2V3W6W0_9BACI|nr:nucleotide pyrophosphohydrolase [Pseudogracilibacillus auburnensis]MBO1003034.1 nucleotide pyrophosphohydrolase [Pseudogracilibacillus auburnensis]PXW88761.1 NTP pyrophosphatase (non-canonical NTP hydrolase) [Pseudogracilibacillus auburnensis]
MKKERIYSTKEMEHEVDQYISQFKEGYFSPLALMARLSEEVGELAREINHTYGEKPKKSTEEIKTIEEEIGDILFVLACMTNSLNLDLSEAFHTSITKINTRDKDRWTKKE